MNFCLLMINIRFSVKEISDKIPNKEGKFDNEHYLLPS